VREVAREVQSNEEKNVNKTKNKLNDHVSPSDSVDECCANESFRSKQRKSSPDFDFGNEKYFAD
jgi:hypothetical protein